MLGCYEEYCRGCSPSMIQHKLHRPSGNFQEKIAMSRRREMEEISKRNHSNKNECVVTDRRIIIIISPVSLWTFAITIFQEKVAIFRRGRWKKISVRKNNVNKTSQWSCGTYRLQTKFHLQEISKGKLPCPGGGRWKKIPTRIRSYNRSLVLTCASLFCSVLL